MALPPSGYFTDPVRQNGEAKQAQDDIRDVVASIEGSAAGAAQKTANLSDLPDKAAARGNLDVDQATNSLTAESSAAAADLVAIYDASAGAMRKMTRANFLASVSGQDQTARDMAILNAFDISELMGRSVMSLGAAVVDAFEDTAGVDLASSTGENHNAIDDFFTNLAETIGGTGAQAAAATAGLNSSFGKHGGMQFTAVQSGTLTQATFNCGTVTTPGDYHVELWTNSGSSPGTKIGASSATVNISASGVKTFTWTSGPSIASGTVYWIVLVSEGSGDFTANICNAVTGYKSCRDNTITSLNAGSEVNPSYDFIFGFTTGAQGDMTLVSETITAASAPSTVRVTLDHEDVTGTAVLNTDITMEVSRDAGTTWTAATLAALRDAGSGRKVFVADLDLSGQPSGTDVVLRGKQLNGKVGRWHRWAVEADVPLAF
jgi:hypothetical protein